MYTVNKYKFYNFNSLLFYFLLILMYSFLLSSCNETEYEYDNNYNDNNRDNIIYRFIENDRIKVIYEYDLKYNETDKVYDPTVNKYLYDVKYNNRCNLNIINNEKICCNSIEEYLHLDTCTDKDGCYLLYDENMYNKFKTYFIEWNGYLNDKNIPCFDYESNGIKNKECTHVDNVVCELQIIEDKMIPYKCVNRKDKNNLFVCIDYYS